MEQVTHQYIETQITAGECSIGRIDKQMQIGADLLRAAILCVPFENRPWAARMDPSRGLRFENLLVEDVLHLDDAYDRDDDFLPPLTFASCVFNGPIYLSRARFRTLSFRGSKLAYLRANGIVIDGTLDISNVQSSLDKTCADPYFKFPLRRGVGLENVVAPLRPRSEGAIKRIRPGQPAREHWWHKPHAESDPAYISEHHYARVPLCWVQLRDASIRVDVDAGGSSFAVPRVRPSFFNSPHARHAMDLRGATIGGRLNIGYDIREEPTLEQQNEQEDAIPCSPDEQGRIPLECLWPKRFRFSKKVMGKNPFCAIGGVSIVRAKIGGSVCGSGADLIAVEGNAFSAGRAHVGGNILLDYSWEGQTLLDNNLKSRNETKESSASVTETLDQTRKTNFRALGFVDLSYCTIGSSLYMKGALLGADARSRAELVATGMYVRGSCYLDHYERPTTPEGTSPSRRSPPVRFISQGGIALNRAEILGDLNLGGALLGKGSFNSALYAQNITVKGNVKFSLSRSPRKKLRMRRQRI